MRFADSVRSMPGAAAAFIIASSAWAQGASQTAANEVDVTADKGDQWKITLIGGVEYQFETDVDVNSDFSLVRYGGGIGVQTDPTSDFSMALFTSYTMDVYDFSPGALGLAAPAEPWDNIHTLTASAIFSLNLDNKWTIFGGPLFQSAREANADFGDSITAGGAAGLTFKASRDLVIGGGVAVVSQIEDEARIIPLIIVNWEIANDFVIRNTSTVNVANRNGLELVYKAGKSWEFAFGVASQFSRFRLDDVAPAADGVGEDSSIPLWFRTGYMPINDVKIDLILGVNTDGELELFDADGNGITESNYDAAFFIGVIGSLRF